MPRLKKRSNFQKRAADRLKMRKKREDEKFRIKEHQRSIELRRTQGIEGIQKNENEFITQERTVQLADSSRPRRPKKNKEQVEGNSKKLLSSKSKNELSSKKSKKIPVRYTFDELLDYIRLGRANNPEEENGTPEIDVVVPVDVLINEEGEATEERADESKEDEGNVEKTSADFVNEEMKQEEEEEAEEIVDRGPSRVTRGVLHSGKGKFIFTGALPMGVNLKLQMEAKLVALNARGGLGSCPRGLYACLFCGERLLTRNCLNLHMRSHVPEAPAFACSVCRKKLASAESLLHHERLHTGDFPLRCGECGRGFSARQALRAHQRTHTGERPFRCEECGKRFAQRAALANHMWTHARRKKYACDVCGKGYSRKDYAERHVRKAHA